MNSNIIILTSSTGGGHDTRARSFKNWFLVKKYNVIIDSILENSSKIEFIGVQIYNSIQKYFPKLHSIYWWIVELYGIFKSKFKFPYKVYCIKNKPNSIILSVHDFTNRGFFDVIRIYSKKIYRKILINTYCGEFSGGYGFSNLWVSTKSDFIFFRTFETLKYVYYKYRGSLLYKTKFKQCFNIFPPSFFYIKLNLTRYALTKMFNLLPNKFTILLGSGLTGSNIHVKLINHFQKSWFNNKLQLLVVCGRNKSAFTKLKQLFKNLKNVTVLGYCKKMPFLLKISHVVISRSGSNLNAEALYFNCIIFIFNFMGTMPQEYLILNHFKKKNYGIILKERFKFKSLNEAVSLFLKNPQMYIKLKRIFKVRAELFTKSSISCKDIMINYIRSLNNNW